MSTPSRWSVNPEEQQKLISRLTAQLPSLRAKLGISQRELSALVGMSRQTYSAIENGRRTMPWSTYLSLLLFFDYNRGTHRMLRAVSAFPDEAVDRFNRGSAVFSPENFALDGKSARETAEMLDALDEQGMLSLLTTLYVEYARCTGSTKKIIEALKD